MVFQIWKVIIWMVGSDHDSQYKIQTIYNLEWAALPFQNDNWHLSNIDCSIAPYTTYHRSNRRASKKNREFLCHEMILNIKYHKRKTIKIIRWASNFFSFQISKFMVRNCNRRNSNWMNTVYTRSTIGDQPAYVLHNNKHIQSP